MLILAMAASCSVGKEYTSRVFGKPKQVANDTTALAKVRFLQMDSLNNHPDMIVVTMPGEMETEPAAKPVIAKNEPANLPTNKDGSRNKKTRED